jgi:hypothetical protein
MANPMITEVDCTTNESVTREMTAAELKAHEARSAEMAEMKAAHDAEQAAVAAAKSSAQDKLAALGLTVEEIAALSK